MINTVLPPIHFVISQLMPQGLHVLAGAPKVGKSWLALWLCLQTAKGEPVWTFPTAGGSVLYLCLEDSRIQRRLLDIPDEASENLFFAAIYARQASNKTKAAKQARAKPGMFLGSHAPFGYLKDPNDRHHLKVF